MANKVQSQPNVTLSEAAVDGLLAGGAAGVAMALYLLIAEGIGGVGPSETLAGFDPSGGGSPLAGALAHLAVAAVYGAFFGGLRRLIPFGRDDRRLSLLFGLAFGLALWALAVNVVLSAQSPLRALSPVHFGLAHALYGLTLGAMLQRRTG